MKIETKNNATYFLLRKWVRPVIPPILFDSLQNSHVNLFGQVYLLKCVDWRQGVIWLSLFEISPLQIFLLPK